MRTISSRPVPLHFQITNDLRNDIKEGKWNLGDQFPTDKQLMEQYGVSSTTVRVRGGNFKQADGFFRGDEKERI